MTDELESPLPEPSSLDDHTHLTLDEHIHRSIIDGLKGHHKSMKGRGMVVSPGSDAELLVSMAQRLKAVERELLTTKREVIEKVGEREQRDAKFQGVKIHEGMWSI